MKDVWVSLVTVFGLGRLRPASGTWGSLPPPAIAAGLIAVGAGPADHPLVYSLVIAGIALTFSLACLCCGDRAEARFGHDPAEVVADETAGQCLPLLALPPASLAGPGPAAATLACAFVLFRTFDVLKPWPAGRLQKLPGGAGILLDDLAAGAQAFLVMQLVTRGLA